MFAQQIKPNIYMPSSRIPHRHQELTQAIHAKSKPIRQRLRLERHPSKPRTIIYLPGSRLVCLLGYQHQHGPVDKHFTYFT